MAPARPKMPPRVLRDGPTAQCKRQCKAAGPHRNSMRPPEALRQCCQDAPAKITGRPPGKEKKNAAHQIYSWPPATLHLERPLLGHRRSASTT
eukprot:7616326-Pyramimonas_sp.AAC.1